MVVRPLKYGLLLLVVLASDAARAETIPLSDFAQLRQVWLPTISPSGRYVAAVVHDRKGPVICVSDFGGRDLRPILRLTYGEERVAEITWINDDRLLVSMVEHENLYDAEVVPVRLHRSVRQISIGRQGGEPVELMKGKTKATLISRLPNDPEHVLIESYHSVDRGRSVFTVNVVTGKSTKSVRNEHKIDRWFADPQGNVVLGWRVTRDGRALFHRPPGAERWEKTWSASGSDGQRLVPVFVNGDDAVVLRYAGQTGSALWRFNVREGTFGGLLFEYEDNQLLTALKTADGMDIGGVEYFEHGVTQIFWDSALAKTAGVVRRSLPGLETSIASISRDGQRVIVRASKPGGPIAYFWFDIASKTADAWLSEYPALADFGVPVTQKHTVDLGDGVQLEGVLSLPEDGGAMNPPLVLFFDNVWWPQTATYNPYVAYLVSRGYAVFVGGISGLPGSLSDTETRLAAVEAQVPDEDDPEGDFLVELVGSQHDQVCVIGVGFGSLLAQAFVQDAEERIQCAISIAGISDLYKYAKDLRPRQGIPAEVKGFSKLISPVEHAETMSVPMLLIHGDDDRDVPVQHSRSLYRKLRKKKQEVEYLELSGGDYHFENEAHRLQILEAMDEFLTKHLHQADGQ